MSAPWINFNAKCIDGEQWKDIDGYDGFYMVSNYGRVRSMFLPRYNKFRVKILTVSESKTGYSQVTLYKDSKPKHHYVHRLVASTFVDNADPLKTEVNHIDENKSNNCVSNLEWCSSSGNKQHGTLPQRRSQWRKNNKDQSKPIAQLDLNGNLIQSFPSVGEARRCLGVDKSAIGRVCNGVCKTHFGYKWAYVAGEGS
jgi:hypothetical protein